LNLLDLSISLHKIIDTLQKQLITKIAGLYLLIFPAIFYLVV